MKPKYNKIKLSLRENDIDGAIVHSPENFTYITAYSSHQHTVSRSPNFACAVFNNVENEKPTAICMDFEYSAFLEYTECNVKSYDTWVCAKTFDKVLKNELPQKKDVFKTALTVLIETVYELNLQNKTIGLELDFLPTSYYYSLKEQLPNAKFVNISNLFLKARAIKDDDEIAFFKKLANASDIALNYTTQFIKEGVKESELFDIYKQKVIESNICLPSGWSSFCTGTHSGRLCRSTNSIIKNGDIVKFDGGVNGDTNFYTTDFSRSYIVGDADPIVYKIKEKLCTAQKLMIDSVKDGLPFSELFSIGFNCVKKDFKCYERGHLGHSISMGPQTADAPFVSPNESAILKKGMVLCIEVPFYMNGYGGFNIEDMVLVTEKGCEVLTPITPHWLTSNNCR